MMGEGLKFEQRTPLFTESKCQINFATLSTDATDNKLYFRSKKFLFFKIFFSRINLYHRIVRFKAGTPRHQVYKTEVLNFFYAVPPIEFFSFCIRIQKGPKTASIIHLYRRPSLFAVFLSAILLIRGTNLVLFKEHIL